MFKPSRAHLLVPLMAFALLPSLLGGLEVRSAAAQEKIVLDVWIFEGEEDLLPALEEAFEAAHPNIDVQTTLIPEDQYVVKLDTAMAAASPPDVGYLYDRQWVKVGNILPLDEMIAAHDIDLADLNQAIMQGVCTIDGQVYCLGSYTGAVVLLYNKAMFDAAGLEYPSATEPLTVDEYAELAAKLTVPNADISQQVWGGTAAAPYWWMSRDDYVSEDGRQVEGLINDEPTKHAYEVLGNMIAQGHAPSESVVQSLGGEGDSDLFLQGKLAMSIGDFAGIRDLEDAGIDFGVATLPVEKAGDPPYSPMWTDSFAVFSGSDHPEEAQEFVAFLATEGQRLRVEVTGQPPLSAKAAAEFGWVDQGNSAAREQFLQVAGAGIRWQFIPGFGDVTAPLSDAFNQIAGGEITASEALDGVAPRMQDSLDEAWATWEKLG